MLDVSVIVASVGKSDLLSELVDALLHASVDQVEVIVVVSGSDARVDVSERALVVVSEEPLAAATARNLGASVATKSLLFFIDDDNRLVGDVVGVLAALLAENSDVVLVGPTMYDAANPSFAYCSGVVHGRLFGRTLNVPNWRLDWQGIRTCDAVPNAYMVRASQFQEVDGFDDVLFPMDFEESDLAFKLRHRFQGRVVTSARASVVHRVVQGRGAAVVPKAVNRAYWVGRNRSLFYVLHFSLWSWLSWMLVGQPVALVVYSYSTLRFSSASVRRRVALVLSLWKGFAAGAFISASCIGCVDRRLCIRRRLGRASRPVSDAGEGRGR